VKSAIVSAERRAQRYAGKAEGEGFEPSVEGLPLQRLSSPPPDAADPRWILDSSGVRWLVGIVIGIVARGRRPADGETRTRT